MSFDDLGLGPQIVKAINECGYDEPTPIQAQAIPAILMMRDVVGLAQTGTGKTASFILPMLEILHGGRARARMPRSLILSPTRELATQIAENFDTYGKYHKLNMALLIGGSSMGPQMKNLDKGVDVLIATPGRLLDLFERGSILLSDIKLLVIDEADRMLDMGFIPDIDKIVSLVPFTRQTLLFSATMPPEIKKLADKFLSNPKTIKVANVSSAAETVEQNLMWLSKREKKKHLHDLLQNKDMKSAFIFCNRKRDISGLTRWLGEKGYKAAPMHGDLQQSQRNETLQDFKDGKINIMVCSDVAGRGIDVSGVSHVFNYDIPFNAEDYVHRIGRTGRAGMKGHAWSFAVKGDDEKFVKAIEQMVGKPIPVAGSGDASGESKESAGGQSKGQEGKRNHRKTERRDDRGNREKSPRDRSQDTSSKPSHKDSRKPAQESRKSVSEGRDKGFGDHLPDFMKF